MKMEIRFLKSSYIKGEQVYNDFLNNTIGSLEEHYDDKIANINSVPDFPIYINVSENVRAPLFVEAINIISNHYLDMDREYSLDGQFWHSLLLLKKRDYILEKYPAVKESESNFKNVVVKKFDWENYIYKCVLAAQYVNDNVEDPDKREFYYNLIANNLDVYNYIIKYEIFRNDKFLLNVLDIIYDNDLSEILKAKIKDRPDLGKDERVGRRVIFELNKSYPVVLAPTLDKNELEVLFLENLKKYTPDI